MSDPLFPFAVLAVFVSILAGGFIVFSAPKATAIAAAVSEKSNSAPIVTEVARAAPQSKPATTTSSGRQPVPLSLHRHAEYWVDTSQPPATTTEGAVTGTQEKNGFSAAAAKATIEADGYKNVKALVRAPDGAWRGLALRGATEVAISVDMSGSVSAE